MTRYEIRPLGHWDRPKTDPRAGSGRFRAPWSSTLDLLGREVELLGGDMIVIQIDVQQGEFRRDGMLAARAKVGFPGVKVSFESIHGPLTYATDAYEPAYCSDPPAWQANIRAIALALQALRAVDRYGVTRSGEQYRGWTAIASKPAVMTREQAAEFLAHWAGLGTTLGLFDGYPAAVQAAYRAAAKRAHPDIAHDDGDTMARLNAARDLLLNGARP